MVSGHQISRATTITVVICMMRSALPLDSVNALGVFPPNMPVIQQTEEYGEMIHAELSGWPMSAASS
jgi:hypothetical protein